MTGRSPQQGGLPSLRPVLLRTWVAVAGGIVAGVVLAAAAVVAWSTFFAQPEHDPGTASAPGSLIELFRLPPGSSREMLVVPAGPDCRGEPLLSRKLFPGEEPPRRFAAVMLANVSDRDAWEFDLDVTPLRYADSEGGELLTLAGLEHVIDGAVLSKVDELRLRSLGVGTRKLRLEPGTLRRLLIVLPPSRQLSDLSHVQWGVTELRRERLDLEQVHRFREDPAAALRGR